MYLKDSKSWRYKYEIAVSIYDAKRFYNVNDANLAIKYCIDNKWNTKYYDFHISYIDILNVNINHLDLGVRHKNVFIRNQFNTINELINYCINNKYTGTAYVKTPYDVLQELEHIGFHNIPFIK